MGGERRLLLVKGRQHYIFTYHPGREAELLSALVDLADDQRCDFDWLDAAVLSFQVERRIGRLDAPARSS